MKKMTIEMPGKDQIVCDVDEHDTIPFQENYWAGREFVGEVVYIREGVNGCTVVVRNECTVSMGERPEWVTIGAKALVDIDGLIIKHLQ
ncbi:MAG: hypothetical protein ABMA02_20180 [Saprospiraceae bacterium]